jgi:hypothetical protein
LLDQYGGCLLHLSHHLNYLFAFSAIRTTGRFVPFQGLANVVLEGQIYHKLRDLVDIGHSMHWFLYDETARIEQAQNQSIPEETINIIRQFLEQVNPYIHNLCYAMGQVQDESTPLAIELTMPTSGGNIAAIINTNGLCYVNPQRVILFC